jgi:hypothetical protein
MFEKAARLKLRFPSVKGSIGVEDLWDLSSENLNTVFKTLNREVKVVGEESLDDTKTSDDDVLNLKIQIVRHIDSVKKKEAADKLNEKTKSEEKRKLLWKISRKRKSSRGSKLFNRAVERGTSVPFFILFALSEILKSDFLFVKKE